MPLYRLMRKSLAGVGMIQRWILVIVLVFRRNVQFCTVFSFQRWQNLVLANPRGPTNLFSGVEEEPEPAPVALLDPSCQRA
jgi:hypothetical protein